MAEHMMPATRWKLDYAGLHHSMGLLWIGLVVFGWIGLAWGGVLTAGAGFALLAPGIFTVPLWGTVFGFLGLSRARSDMMRQMNLTSLPPDHPLTASVHRMADELGLPAKPWVSIMPDDNAFAIGSGPDTAMVVVGKPLLETMHPLEVEAIIGHELGHIANNDMKRMEFARSFQNSLTWFLYFRGLKMFARWLLTTFSEIMIQRMSREREYWADAIGAALTSKEHMISALKKLHGQHDGLSEVEDQNARIMFIGRLQGLFATHPSLEQRVAALEGETYLRQLPFHREELPQRESPLAVATLSPALAAGM